MASDDEGWVSHDSGKQRKPVDDGEDDSIALDSKEYEEWRRGTDDDSYMSDTEYFGGTTSDSTPVSSSGDSGDDSSSDRNIIIVAVVVVLLLIGSGLLGIYLYSQNAEDVASWPTVEGTVWETYYEDEVGEECPGSKLPLRIWEKMARIMIIIITGRAQNTIAIHELGSFTM